MIGVPIKVSRPLMRFPHFSPRTRADRAVVAGTVAQRESAVLPPPRGVARRRSGSGEPADAVRRAALAPALALVMIVVASAAIAIIAAAHKSGLVPPAKGGFPGWMAGPFKGVASGLTRDRDVLSLIFSGLLVLITGCYALVLAGGRHVRMGWAIAAIVAAHVFMVLCPPLTLTDVFNYFDYGRLGTLHDLNPYVAVLSDAKQDASFPFTTWHHLSSPYGPLFTLLTYALVPLGLPVGYWVLKVLTMAASLASLLLVARIARRLGRPEVPAVLFVGLNPLLLVFGLGGVHNDFFTMLLVVAGIALLLEHREARATASIVVAAGVKVTAAMLLPFALLGSRDRIRAVGGALLAAGVIAAAGLAAFGPHGPALGAQTHLVSPLGLMNLLGLALGFGGETEGMRVGSQLVLVAVLAYLALRTWRGASWIEMSGWAVLALVLSLSWVVPWYVMWLLPFAAIGASRRLRVATLALTLVLLVTSLPATAQLLADGVGWYPNHTKLGRKHVKEIRKYLK
jgi:alpha-1,6-mannosyltransferase